MNQKEYYENSLNLFEERIANRLQDDDEDRLFNWMLTQFHFLVDLSSRPSTSYNIKFKGFRHEEQFGLKHSAICIIILKTEYFSDFCELLGKVEKTFNQNPHFIASSHFPENEEDVSKLVFEINFSLH